MSPVPDYYPVHLRLEGRLCVVVGGGEVAQRKVLHLQECDAVVAVVAPSPTSAVSREAEAGRLRLHRRPYRDGDLEGAFLAIAATDDRALNRRVAEEAERRGILLNVVDTPELCSFIAPAIVRRGPVQVSISTGGASPALARRLKEEMQRAESCRCLAWADGARVLREARQELRRRRLRVDPDEWQRCMTDELLELARDGREQEATRRLVEALAGRAAGEGG